MSRSVPFLAAVCLAISGACGDAAETSTATDPAPVTSGTPAATTDGSASDAATDPSTGPEPSVAPTLPAAAVAVDDVAFTDPVITGTTEAVCHAFGTVADEGSAALVSLLADGGTITDAVSGETHAGAEGIEAYADRLRAEGLQDAVCLHLLQADRWVAHTITLLLDGTAVRAGVLAVHVDDGGRVDQIVAHLSDRADPPRERVDPGTGTSSTANRLCERYVAGDLDGILGLMSDEPAVHAGRELAGRDGVTEFATSLPYDVHTCGVAIQNERWEAVESIMTDPATGRERSMLSVVALDPGNRVTDHWFYFDA